MWIIVPTNGVNKTFKYLNIRYGEYQLHFDLLSNKTDLYATAFLLANDALVKFDHIIDIELTEECIKNKIQTILTYI